MTTLGNAARSLRRSPAFTALTVATLALGIGATTATFAVFEQVILRPLPGVRAQDGVVVAWGDHTLRDFPHYPILWDAYERVRADSRRLSVVAATNAAVDELLLDDGGALTPLSVGRTLGDFFGALGVSPAAGRVLGLDDEAPGAPRVLVVSHAVWQRRWGGDPAAVGSTLLLGGTRFTVVGVLPEGFDYPRGAEVWTPMLPFFPRTAEATPPYVEVDLVGRLAPGATPADAATELETLFRTDPLLAADYEGVRAVVRTLPDLILGDLRPTLFLLFAAALLVLAVAMVNVANLIFVRSTGREVALAVRRALGADSLRLTRESLAESLLLGAFSTVLGLLLAAAALEWVLPLAPEGLARLDQVGLEWSTVGAAAALSVLLVGVLGILPATWRTRAGPAAALRGGRGSVGGHAFVRKTLLAAQAGLALWAVAAAALMVRTLDNLQALDLGFDAEALLAVQLDHAYGVGQAPAEYPSQLEAVVDRLEAHPSVRGATPALAGPLAGSSLDALLRLEGQTPEESARSNPYLNTDLVLPRYFETLGVAVIRGRTFADGIGPESPLEVVVNESAANALWPGEDPIGRRVEAFGGRNAERWWTVVGVVADMRYRTLLEPRLSAYFPLRQLPLVPPRYLLVRTSQPAELLPLVSSAFAETNPSVRVVGASSVRSELAAPLARPRLSLAVLGAFGVVVLLLAGVGVYGVMAASVRSRLGEVGVRMACGATPADVGAMIVRQGMAFAVIGVTVGLTAALATGRLLQGLLFGVTPADVPSLAAACALVLGVAAAACVPPSLRAARTDPVRVLREE